MSESSPSTVPGSRVSRRGLLSVAGASVAGAALASASSARAGEVKKKPKPAKKSKPPATADTQATLNVAATVEVLTTVVTNVALQKLSLQLTTDAINTVSAAAREELDHYTVLTKRYGAKPATSRVWVPDAVFADPTSLFTTLVVGEHICVDLYLVATTVWATAGQPALARAGAELVGNESVHRALARQALGLEPNDRAFALYNGIDPADGPGNGTTGFTSAQGAIAAFEKAGVGFGKQGAAPGSFYDFTTIAPSTPTPTFVNTAVPS